MSVRARLRIEESVSEARAFRAEVTAWREGWGTIDALGGHLTQLDLLTNVVLGLTDAIAARAEAIDPRLAVGEAYDECRRQDRKLLHARRLWQWYAGKFDQRTGRDAVQVETLTAADEIIWSCWKTSFAALGTSVPAAPIAYLAAEYAASATPRTDFPYGLRPGTDDLLKTHLEQLPVPVIGLPPVCRQRPWWLIIAVHETGHHLQFDIPDLEQQTRKAVTRAAGEAAGQPGQWEPWCRELFADACSVLLAGPAAIWAVRELETRNPEAMRVSPSVTYPPPVIRLAMMNEVLAQAGLPGRLSAGPPPAEPDEHDIGELLTAVPAVAAALLNLTSPPGRTLRDLAERTDSDLIDRWRAALSGPDDPVAHPSLDAARFCAAAGVAAWQDLAGQDAAPDAARDKQEGLAARLRATIPLCREPGTRAAQAAPPAARDIAGRFLADLDEEVSRA